MDGRITALRVGFLSSSHQLAGLNFLLPALLSITQGLCPFISIFAIFFFTCWSWFSVWQVWLWSSSSFFSHSSYMASGGRLGGAKAAMPSRPSILGDKCFRLYFAWLFFPPTACAENLGNRRAGLRGSVAAPPRFPGSESKLRLFLFLTYRVFMAAVCVCVCFFLLIFCLI